ncbi:MAG TPA: hypothetical protein VF284_10850 [Rhodanobacteraceae bacterium]
MRQEKFPDYFQGAGADSFRRHSMRLRFLADRVVPMKQCVLNTGVGNRYPECVFFSVPGMDVRALGPDAGATERAKWQAKRSLRMAGIAGAGDDLCFEASRRAAA